MWTAPIISLCFFFHNIFKIKISTSLRDCTSSRVKMFSRGEKDKTEINVILDEPLTNDSCTKVVMELVKYILYQKQQIPFAYDALAQYHTRKEVSDRNTVSFKTLSSTLKIVADQLSSQFFLKGCDIREVAIVLGATILSPKLYIGIELPSYVLNSRQHKEYQHSSRKPLLKLMRLIENYITRKIVHTFTYIHTIH